MKNWLIWKDPDAGKDWRQEDKVTTEDEMVGWYHRLNGHEFEQTPGDGNGQGSLAYCSPWDHKQLDTTEWLNGPNSNFFFHISFLFSSIFLYNNFVDAISSLLICLRIYLVLFHSLTVSSPPSYFFPVFFWGGEGGGESAFIIALMILGCLLMRAPHTCSRLAFWWACWRAVR